MLGALAEHMRKNNIVRVCRVNPNSQIYFLDSSKTEYFTNQDPEMIFLIIS